MTSKMTPRLPSHSGMSPGGKTCPQVKAPDQSPPSPSVPIRQKHRFGGTLMPGKLPGVC
jgi:hypothetical protein